MMKEIGVGIAGTGFMGKTHTYAHTVLPFYYRMPFKTRLVGICSRKLENAQSLKDAYEFQFASDSLDALLERDDIHVVHICTPNALHFAQVKAALDAGKHVYCDKPLAMDSRQARELAEIAEAKGLTAQVAFQNRFFPATLRARELVDEGRLGRVLSFRTQYLHASLADPLKPLGWKQDAAQCGGGVLVDMGSHVIDMMYYLLGEYREVLCETLIAFPERPGAAGGIMGDEAAFMLANMKNGAVGTLEASKIATGTNDDLRFEINGTEGALRFSIMKPSWLEFYDNTLAEAPLGGSKGTLRIDCVQKYPPPSDVLPVQKNSIGWLRAHVHCLYTFLTHVYNEEPGDPSFADGAYVQRVIEQAYRSRDERRWVQV